MDSQSQTTQPISDEQELTKVLAGMSKGINSDLEIKETSEPKLTPSPIATPVSEVSDNPKTSTVEYNPPIEVDTVPVVEKSDIAGYNPPTNTPSVIEKNNVAEYSPPVDTSPSPEKIDVVEFNPPVDISPSAENGSLESIKKDALIELRPLVDKLNLAPEEKFDIYLLLLRSTDDKALIEPAHEVARNIADEVRRAQALLDIIKEIDYLSSPTQTTA